MTYIPPKALFLKNKFNESFNSHKKEWAIILGHLFGDGGFSCKRVYYCNTHTSLLNEFEDTFNFLFKNFGLNLRRKEFVLVCDSVYLFSYLKGIDITYILKENKYSKIVFLKALFDDEGSVSKKGIISILMKDYKIIDILFNLLKDLKIKNLTKYKIFNKKYQREYYAFRISKQENKKFLKIIGFTHKHKLERANKYTSLNRVKLQEIKNGQFKITLPKNKIIRKGWKKGQELDIDLNERGNLEIIEVGKKFKKKAK